MDESTTEWIRHLSNHIGRGIQGIQCRASFTFLVGSSVISPVCFNPLPNEADEHFAYREWH